MLGDVWGWVGQWFPCRLGLEAWNRACNYKWLWWLGVFRSGVVDCLALGGGGVEGRARPGG